MAVTFTDLEAVSFGLDLTRCRAQYQRAPIGPQTGAADGEARSGSRRGSRVDRAGGAVGSRGRRRGLRSAPDERRIDAA